VAVRPTAECKQRSHDDGVTKPPAPTGLRLGLLNARSVTTKSTAIADTITAERLDVLALTETWHQTSDDVPLKRCAPTGYTIVDAPRCSTTASRGGGVALLFDSRFTAKRFTFAVQPTTFELLGCSLRSASTSAICVVIYRPTSQSVNELFFEELTQLLEIVAAYRCEIIITGDFNLHVNNAADQHARRFNETLASFDLVQSVNAPTHRDGNTLDLVITRRDNQPVACSVQPPNIISDHGLVTCCFGPVSFVDRQQTRYVRPWKKLDRGALVESLRGSVLCNDVGMLQQMSADELFDAYDSTMRRIVDQHVPASLMTVRDRRRLSPWFDEDCRASRRRSRMLERRYRRTRKADDCLAWIRQVRAMHALYGKKQDRYWTKKVEAHAGDSKKLWRSLSAVLMRNKNSSVPASQHISAVTLAEFFVDKVKGVRADTDNAPPPTFTLHDGQTFCQFREVSMDEVRRVIMDSPPKSCVLDPIPTFILRDIVDVVVPFFWVLCNTSLQSGSLSESQKMAVVTPVLKKANADPDDPKNYRPISNLTFMSKVIERLVTNQLTQHLVESGLMPTLQSAYRRHHSTESALLKVLSDILDAADSGQVTLLGLLDLSAAFDTVDHDILLTRLQTSFGAGGQVLQWLRSFLTDRSQAVYFRGETSSFCSLEFGVPQGSVLGPLLFLLYTADVIELARSHGVCVHAYADDTQLYTSCSAADAHTSAAKLLDCINSVGQWMSANKLKLNADKTQFLWLGPAHLLESVKAVQLTVGGSIVKAADTVRDLGVTLDAQLSMKPHVNGVVRSCFYQLRQLRSVSRSVPADALRTLVHAFITCRIDYCNAVLYGVADAVIRRLQAVLHAAARLLTGVRRNEHITPTLRDELHWLPVKQRVDYKLALTAYDCLHGRCPSYLNDVCIAVSTVAGRAHLRSADRCDLVIPRVRTVRFGRRSFYSAAPSVWNRLPLAIRRSDSRNVFKCRLKSFLYDCAYV